MAKKSPIRAYRKEKKLSAKEVADQLGVAESTVRSYENGSRVILADMALIIEKKLGIHRSELRADLWPKEQVEA